MSDSISSDDLSISDTEQVESVVLRRKSLQDEKLMLEKTKDFCDFVLEQNNGQLPRYLRKNRADGSESMQEERKWGIFLQNRRVAKKDGRGGTAALQLLDDLLPGWDDPRTRREALEKINEKELTKKAGQCVKFVKEKNSGHLPGDNCIGDLMAFEDPTAFLEERKQWQEFLEDLRRRASKKKPGLAPLFSLLDKELPGWRGPGSIEAKCLISKSSKVETKKKLAIKGKRGPYKKDGRKGYKSVKPIVGKKKSKSKVEKKSIAYESDDPRFKKYHKRGKNNEEMVLRRTRELVDFILNQNNGIYPRYYSKEKIGRSKRLAEERRMAVFLQNRRMSKREGKGYNSVYDLLDKHLPGWDSSQNVEERLMDRAYNYVGQWKPEDHLGNSSIQEDFLEEMRQLQKDGKGYSQVYKFLDRNIPDWRDEVRCQVPEGLGGVAITDEGSELNDDKKKRKRKRSEHDPVEVRLRKVREALRLTKTKTEKPTFPEILWMDLLNLQNSVERGYAVSLVQVLLHKLEGIGPGDTVIAVDAAFPGWDRKGVLDVEASLKACCRICADFVITRNSGYLPDEPEGERTEAFEEERCLWAEFLDKRRSERRNGMALPSVVEMLNEQLPGWDRRILPSTPKGSKHGSGADENDGNQGNRIQVEKADPYSALDSKQQGLGSGPGPAYAPAWFLSGSTANGWQYSPGDYRNAQTILNKGHLEQESMEEGDPEEGRRTSDSSMESVAARAATALLQGASFVGDWGGIEGAKEQPNVYTA